MSLAQRFLTMVEATMKASDCSSAMAIAEGQAFSHDSVYRVLEEAGECFSGVTKAELTKAKAFEGGYLILDDSFMMRYSSGELELKKLRDSARNRWAYGYQVVLLIWTNGKVRLPIGFRVFTCKHQETSKIELALELLNEAKRLGFKPEYVLFDSWYASQSILERLYQHGWAFVTRLKRNRVLGSTQLKADKRPYFSKVGKLRGLTFEVIIFRQGRKYFCSNNTALDRAAIKAIYKRRQAIEEVFRCLKQELGWQGSRYRTRTTLTNHLALGLAAFAVIERQRQALNLSFYKLRRSLISGRIAPPNLSPLDYFAAA
jgi:putative transposase